MNDKQAKLHELECRAAEVFIKANRGSDQGSKAWYRQQAYRLVDQIRRLREEGR